MTVTLPAPLPDLLALGFKESVSGKCTACKAPVTWMTTPGYSLFPVHICGTIVELHRPHCAQPNKLRRVREIDL